MAVIVGCEESQAVCLALRKKGIEAYSCDTRPCSGGYPEYHLQMDVFEAIKGGRLVTQAGTIIFIEKWDGGIFFPDCTYLTCSAEWAYKDPDYIKYPDVGYHQKVKPGTLVGHARRQARADAFEFFMSLYNCGIKRIGMENPVGIMSRYFRKPNQTIQPYQFGDDASKRTCLWLKNLPLLIPTVYVAPRIVDGKPRWANQTDGGQNKLSPSDDRAVLRSKTYTGIAEAMAEQWAPLLT